MLATSWLTSVCMCIFQAIKQMYVLVLGLDVLGNPFGLIRGLSQGVEAFFYEPYQVGLECSIWGEYWIFKWWNISTGLMSISTSVWLLKAFVFDLLSVVFQGAIQGPEEFVEGMALGVKALVGGAVGKHMAETYLFHMRNLKLIAVVHRHIKIFYFSVFN